MTPRCPVELSGRTILAVGTLPDTGALRYLLEREGHRVLTAEGATQTLRILAEHSVQILLLDYQLPGLDAERLIERVRERDGLVQIVVQTSDPSGRLPRELLRRLPIQGYHYSVDGSERLLVAVDMALRAYDQLAQLHDAERLKSELLANVSHEFRTPLNVIVGYVDLLREGAFGISGPEALPVYDKVLANASHLLALVEDFLDFSKLEAGAVAVRPEAVPLTPFLREVAECFTLLVRGKPIEFVTVIPEDLPPVVAEAAKLRVVIQNLLANAQKFTTRGRIGLAAEVCPDGRVAILVSDTGPGIAPEHREVIFDVFHQLRPHEGRAKGVGLGLALARRFARMMEGDVLLESVVGKGSTFTVVLRAASGGTSGKRTHVAAA